MRYYGNLSTLVLRHKEAQC